MTIIIALKDEENKKIYLGADRQGTAGDISHENFGCKLLKVEIPTKPNEDEEYAIIGNDEMYIAFSGSHFLHQYLFNVFQAPVWNTEINFMNYLYNDYFYELKQELQEQKLIKKNEEVLDSDAGLLIVHGEDIYTVYHDLSIVESPRGYAVKGAGIKFAVSIIENNLQFHNDMSYKQIISEALYTTGKLNIYCNTDYDILTIEY